jgi:hypothetical protein
MGRPTVATLAQDIAVLDADYDARVAALEDKVNELTVKLEATREWCLCPLWKKVFLKIKRYFLR